MTFDRTFPVHRNPGAAGKAGGELPTLRQIYFYLTEGCNLRCRHCWIGSKFQAGQRKYPALDPGLFRLIVRQAKPLGLFSVKLTGGEPLMHPQIGDILETVRSERLDLTVETNGVLCTPALSRDLARSGLRHLSVSLDGADAETHEWVRGVKGCFEAALQGIRNLVAAGIRPQVIMTLMRRNIDQIEAIVRLAETLGCSSVKFNLLQPTARGEGMHEAGEAIPVAELVRLGEWVEADLSRRTDLRLAFSRPIAFRPLGGMFGREGIGCGICSIRGILGVLSDGAYALCGIGESVPELVFGQAPDDDLLDVWSSSAVLREIREGMPRRLEGVCGECLMKGVCLGGCIAQNYYRGGDLWAPNWFCEEALAAGLFPPTRLRARSAAGRDLRGSPGSRHQDAAQNG